MKPNLEKYFEKSGRMRSPKIISVTMRPQVHDFLRRSAADYNMPITALIRGVLEDFYDLHSGESSEEVTGNE